MIDLETARAILRRTRPACRRDGYPAEVREQVLALTRAHQASGRSLTAIAGDLGLATSTLSRWLDTSVPSSAPWLPVTMTAPLAPARGEALLRIVAPSGFALEGLDLETAVRLLERWA